MDTRTPKVGNPLPTVLRSNTKEVLKIVLVDHLIDKDIKVQKITVDGKFAWELVPKMTSYEEWWSQLKSQDDLESVPFFKDMILHLKNQFRKDGAWLEKKIKARKKELEEEADSKESKILSQKTILNAPVTRKTKAKNIQPLAKRQRREAPEDRTESEYQEPAQIIEEQPAGDGYINDAPPNYTFHEQQIIARELRIDFLWAKLREGRRAEKELLQEYQDLKRLSRYHHTDPLADFN